MRFSLRGRWWAVWGKSQNSRVLFWCFKLQGSNVWVTSHRVFVMMGVTLIGEGGRGVFY